MHCIESSSGLMKFRAFDIAINTSVVTRSGTPWKTEKISATGRHFLGKLVIYPQMQPMNPQLNYLKLSSTIN